MDPWLEAPALWPGVHTTLAGVLRELLVPPLRPRYFVDVERRLTVLDEDDPGRRLVVPDLTVTETGRPGAARAHPVFGTPTVLHMLLEPVELSEPRVVIRTVGEQRVVAVVELLSPANKTLGSRSREDYLVKRRDLLRSDAHLLEVDLLRAGARIPSVDPLPACDYLVHVSRAGLRPRGEVYAWTVRDPAPVVPVPLLAGDPDAPLDLGAALRLTYARGGYDLALDYGRPPVPPLGPEDAAWAASRTG